MSLPVLFAFAGVLVVAVATGLLAGRCVREPLACFIMWTAGSFGLTVALVAEVMGLASGFGPVTFRAIQLGAQLAAPMLLAWGLLEFVVANESVLFGVRLVGGALTVVAGLVLATDSLSTHPFSKAWPSASVHYQSVGRFALIVVEVVALAGGGTAVGMAAARSRKRPEWRAVLPGVAAIGGALLAVLALRFSLPAKSAFPAVSAVAAGLILVGVTRELEAVTGLDPRSRGGYVDGSGMGSRGRRESARHGDGDAADRRGAGGGGGGAGRYGPRDEYGYDTAYGPPEGYGQPDGYGPYEGYAPNEHASGGYGSRGARPAGSGPAGSGSAGSGFAGSGPGGSGPGGYGSDGYGPGRRQGGYDPAGPYGSGGSHGPRDRYGPDDRAGRGHGAIRAGEWVGAGGAPGFSGHPAPAGPAASGTKGEPEFGADAKPSGSSAGSPARPYGRILIFTLLDDKATDFDRLAEQTAEEVRINEPDTLVYVIHLVPNAPMQRIFYEIYRDRAAFESHENKSYTKRFVAERRAYILATNVIELRVKYAKVAPLPTETRTLSVTQSGRPQLPPGPGPVSPRLGGAPGAPGAPSTARSAGAWSQQPPGTTAVPGDPGSRYGRG